MKKLSIAIVGATIALSAAAQHKIDFPGRQVIQQYQLEQESNQGPNTVAPLAAKPVQTYGVIVELNDPAFDISAYVTDVMSQIDEFVIVSVTPAQMQNLADLPQVRRIEMGYECEPMLKAARTATSVDAVHAGTGLNQAYTGKGVVVGLFDTGLDPNHINFKDANGNPRVKRFWAYMNNTGKPTTSLTDAAAISSYQTEDKNETHGTHVLGIMAGSYNGPADYAASAPNNKWVMTKQGDAGSSVPYYGVAPDADIAITCGPLYQASMLDGIQNIINYAKSVGKPCAINLSVGNNVGPHDGTDAWSVSLDRLGKDAIILISAGNEGTDNISINTPGAKIKTFVGTTNNPSRASGTVDIWGSDNQVYTVRLFAYDRSSQKELFSYTLDQNLAGKTVSQGDMEGFSDSKLSGSLSISSNINVGNNRYNVVVTPNVTGQTGILFGIAIEPKPGQTVDGFTRGMAFMSQSQPGFLDGTPDNSINGLACGENVICVGSFSTTKNFAFISKGNASGTGFVGASEVGSRSNFSSYGWNTANYEPLPHVCAPGEVLISSINKYYVDVAQDPMISAVYTMPGSGVSVRPSHWQPMQGTSMASPFAAGVVALWLEAAPMLKVQDVKDILQETSDTDFLINAEIEKWGAGKINALAGMKKAKEFGDAGVDDIVTDAEMAIVTTTDSRNFDIYVPGASKINANLYSLAGTTVAATSSDSNSATISALGVQSGVYILSITTDKATQTQKIAIR